MLIGRSQGNFCYFFRNWVHVLCWSQLNPEYVVENVVGRGVFKLKCGKEELLLYSKDGASVSQEWIQAIQETTGKYKASAATLRKESSRRTPLKRPDLMRLRRESLSQIMMIRYAGHTVQITLIVCLYPYMICNWKKDRWSSSSRWSALQRLSTQTPSVGFQDTISVWREAQNTSMLLYSRYFNFSNILDSLIFWVKIPTSTV